MLRFRLMRAQRKLASVHNHLPTKRHLLSRDPSCSPAPPLSPSGAAFSLPDIGPG